MRRSWLVIAASALAIAGLPALATGQSLAATGAHPARSHHARALLVCNRSTTPCPPGVAHYTTAQEAVQAARPGDWVLIWPGVYHEKSKAWPAAGVWVATAGVHIRGLDRNGVIIDGSNGPASHPCPASPKIQDHNSGRGRNGVEVWKASGVTIQNLTVWDYPSGAGGS
jgi:hypothetical protein